MNIYEFNNLKNIIESKEKQLYALFIYYRKKGVSIKNIQIYIDSMNEEYVKTFLTTYSKYLSNPEFRQRLLTYLKSQEATNRHSQTRFLDSLYTSVLNYNNVNNSHTL